MKVLFRIFLVITLTFSLISCSTLKVKFTRKSKKGKEPEKIFQESNQVYPADVRYNNHFIYWRSWQNELILNLGKNHKKVVGCADRAFYNLSQMYEMIKPPMQEKLKPYVKQLSIIDEELRKGNTSEPILRKIAKDLENHLWQVKRQFNYSDMKQGNWIKQD